MKNSSFTRGDVGTVSSARQYRKLSPLEQQRPTAISRRSNMFHHIPSVIRVVSKVKARIVVHGIKSALKEVDLIEKGLIKPKSLDQLLNEL